MGSYLDLDDVAAGHPKAEHELHLIREHIKSLEAENAKLIVEREQYENHDVYATLYEDAKALIDPHTKASGGELPTSVIQSFEYLFKFWIEHKAEREAMMKQEPVATVSDWVGARAAKDKISLIVDVPAGFTFLRGQKLYAEPLPAQQIPEGYAIADKTELKKIHRDLDSCQKVIWLAGGFDPSYCKDAQESLKLIDAMLSAR